MLIRLAQSDHSRDMEGAFASKTSDDARGYAIGGQTPAAVARATYWPDRDQAVSSRFYCCVDSDVRPGSTFPQP